MWGGVENVFAPADASVVDQYCGVPESLSDLSGGVGDAAGRANVGLKEVYVIGYRAWVNMLWLIFLEMERGDLTSFILELHNIQNGNFPFCSLLV